MKLNKFNIWIALIFIGACASRGPLPVAEKSIGFDLVAMGSVWSFRIPESSFNEDTWWPMKNQAQVILENYDATFSSWRKDSELSKLGPLMKLRAFVLPPNKKASPLFLEGLEFAKLAYAQTQGAFDIYRPGGLDFGGITKGHVLGELVGLFLQAKIVNFSIDGGGGNQVFAGTFRPVEFLASNSINSIVFRSASGALQHGKQHIFDRSSPHREIAGQSVVYCWVEINKIDIYQLTHPDLKQTKLVGSLSDAFSTALLVRPKGWLLPKFCQEPRAQDLKFL